MADIIITPNTSGRPNQVLRESIFFQDYSWDRDGNVTWGPNHEYGIQRKSFEHQSIGSPFVNGKLQIRPNPYDMTKIESSIGVVKIRGEAESYGGFESYQYLSTGGGYLPDDITGLESEAVSSAREKFLKEVQNASANILLALVERKEILETVLTLTKKAFSKLKEYKQLLERYNRLASPAARKRLLEKHLKGFSAKGLSKSKDKVADLWLFYSYAIMPIILEVKTIVDHVRKIKPRAVHGRARRSFDANYAVNDVYFRCKRVHTGYVSSHVRGYVTVVDPLKKLMSEWGFTNLATIIWERITYSFVIDWFVNIGSWLSSLTALDGVIVTDYNETTTIKNGMSISGFESINSGGWTVSSTIVVPDFFMYKRKKRSVPVTIPKPEIFMDINLSWRRIISGISLLNQQLFRLK